jgi:filamentous hemagglutinin
METPDHLQTASHSRQGTAGAVYRAETRELIQQGQMHEAMAREIRDVRRIATSKYNQAIREMLDYAKSQGWLVK